MACFSIFLNSHSYIFISELFPLRYKKMKWILLISFVRHLLMNIKQALSLIEVISYNFLKIQLFFNFFLVLLYFLSWVYALFTLF